MKPPIGVMPRKLWLETRIQDLGRAIYEYTQAKIYEPVNEWLEELQGLVEERERMDEDD